MVKHEQRAFWKFFSTYFVSVALLILIAGYFYFSQIQQQLLKFEHFSIIEYAKHLKMHEDTSDFKGFTHQYIQQNIPNFSIENFTIHHEYFEKYVPADVPGHYIHVKKSTDAYGNKKRRLLWSIAGVQMLLLTLFALLSYRLAKSALRPLQESINTLDRFAKDLIHDLNTPVTAIKLNLKSLAKEPAIAEHRALKRLQKSTDDIAELHQNLTLLLQEETFQFEAVDVSAMMKEILPDYQTLYPAITFKLGGSPLTARANVAALKQVLNNLLSNACKYNRPGGHIHISTRTHSVTIADSGIGIKEPTRVFERNYAEQRQGSGIGLDIVKRLCDAMEINIHLDSSTEGTVFTLDFLQNPL